MTFNVWTFLFEIVNFVVLAYILHRLLYRPLRAAIDQRRAMLAQTQSDAEAARAQAVAMQEQLQTQLAGMEQERQEAIQQARAVGESERQKLISEAERAIERRQAEVRASIERQREDALRSLRAEVSSSAAELAERLLREAAGTTLQQQLAGHLVEALTRLPDEERSRVRRDWKAADGAVVELAAPLDPGSMQKLNDAVASVVGQQVKLDVETKPALLAGARLRIGGNVWDASLAGQLETVRAGSENSSHA